MVRQTWPAACSLPALAQVLSSRERETMSSLVYSPTTGPGSQKVILKKSVECLHMQMRAVFPSVYSTQHQSNGILQTKRTVLLSMIFGNATVSLPGHFQCLHHKAYQKLRTSQGTCLTQTNTNSFDQRTVYFNPKHLPASTGNPIRKHCSEDKR